MKFAFSLSGTRYMQYLSAITATLSVTSIGMYTTWASPALPQLTSPNSPIGITLTDVEASWVAALLILGIIPGATLAGWLVEKLGRRITLLLSAIPFTVSWIAIVFGRSVAVLYIFRFIAGIGIGIVSTTVTIYNGEIAEKDIRGKLGTTFNILKIVGDLFVFSVGPFLSYTALGLSCCACPIIFVILFWFMPESPYYLIKVGKQEEARKNIIRLSSKNSDSKTIEERLQEIESSVAYDMQNRSTVWELFSNKDHRNALIVMTGIKTLQQLSGLAAIQSYMQTIIESSGSSISPEISSVIAGVIQLPVACLTAFLVDKMGRKPLMIISCIGCAAALIGEGVYFYLQDILKEDVRSLSWLPTTGLLVYLLMNPLGIFTLPWILLGELFATNIKGIAVSAFASYGAVMAFLATKLFQPIVSKWGMHATFWIFALVCILGSLFSLFVQPETKGKSFVEIQETLNRGRKMTNRKQEDSTTNEVE